MLLGTAVTTPTPSVSTFNPAVVLPQTPVTPFMTSAPALAGLQLYRNPFLNGAGGVLAERNGQPPPPPPRPQTIPERCFDAFYSHFHAGHPAVLPKEHLLRLAKDRPLEPLLAAMQWVGSLYVDDLGPARATLLDEAMAALYAPDVAKDGFLVQAMVMVLVGLDGSTRQEEARGLLSDAERIAIEIGLYQRAYAAAHGAGSAVLEESWRRTWWDLFVVDGMVAGVHRATNFLLFDIVSDVALPCEEHEYKSGVSGFLCLFFPSSFSSLLFFCSLPLSFFPFFLSFFFPIS